MDDDKYAELYESDVRSLIIDHQVKAKDTKWKAIPLKRILGRNRSNYDEDYFCYERT
jgi:hypothetical protein